MKNILSMDEEKRKVLEDLFSSRRVSVHPEAVSKSDIYIKRIFDNDIENVKEKLKESMSVFPARLLEEISQSERGNIMVVSSSSLPGFSSGHYNPTENRAYITTKALMKNNGAPQEEITHLLDHLLGSGGKGARLSDGYGTTTKLEEFGKEILSLYNDKDNKISEYGNSNPHEFLAQSVRFYITSEPELLHTSLPKVYNMVVEKWLNNEFWKDTLQ